MEPVSRHREQWGHEDYRWYSGRRGWIGSEISYENTLTNRRAERSEC